jgi:hypothetical protein
MAISLPTVLPVVPVANLHDIRGLDNVTTADTVGWPQLTLAVAAQDAALVRAGQPLTSIFTGNYGEAGALDVLGSAGLQIGVCAGPVASWRTLWPSGSVQHRTAPQLHGQHVPAPGSLRVSTERLLSLFDAGQPDGSRWSTWT